MNVYDFDGTIYRGDSSLDFYLFCLRRYPWIVFFLPIQVIGVLAYKLRLMGKTRGKECFFSFLRGIKDVDSCVDLFWEKHEDCMELWYLKQKNAEDVIVSASPDFLLSPICRKLSVRLIASSVDRKTGRFFGRNCFGAEKVRRLCEVYGENPKVDSFYSDSYTDAPLADMADKSYRVNRGKIENWN